MSRLILLALIGVALWWLWRSFNRDHKNDEVVTTKTEDMVVCAHCGVHLPKSDSVVVEQQYFCSVAHRDVHR